MQKLSDVRRYGVYDVLGRRLRVIDDFATAVRLDKLTRDELFDDGQKTQIALAMVYPDPEKVAEAYGDDFPEAFLETLGKAFGMGEVDGGKRVIDYEKDASRILATMRAAYGLGREYEQMPYREVMGLLAYSPHDTPMGQAIYYRTARQPKRDRYNGEYVDEWIKRRDHYRLGGKDEDGEGDANDAATAAFEAMRRRADNG